MIPLQKRASTIVAALLLLSPAAFGQANPAYTKLLQQNMTKKEIAQQSSLLKEMFKDSVKTAAGAATVDTIKKEEPRKETFSAYEDMLKGTIINPDSMLNKVEIFGHSVFKQSKKTSFSPDKQISLPADYPISSGDEIIILLWGRINEELRLVVDRNGQVNIPRIGPVSVAGLPFRVMQKNLSDRIQSIEGVQASVSMGDLSDIRIFIVGEVGIPGQYTVSALTNVTNALFFADGFSKQGSMRSVVLKRNDRTIKAFDFYDFLLSGDNFSNTRLYSGDVVFVPMVKKMATITGNVRRSALYELKGKTSLQDMIQLAGGLTPAAWTNRIQLERFINNEQKIVLDLEITSSEKLPEYEIEDGDIIKIFPVVMMDKNAVYLSGNVVFPRKFEFGRNMRVSGVINTPEQLKPETYFDYAVIRRREPPSFAERIVAFNLGAVLKDSSSAENLELKPLDNIIVYNKDYFEPDRVVSIDGAVTKPGSYKLLENMQIKDLILEAGGLRENASIDRGELYNRTHDGENIRTTKTDFSISGAMKGDPEHNLPLSKFDHVSIRTKLGWEEQQTITLVGEFTYPGMYVVLEGETLGQLIKRAGGFKQSAYLPAAILTRESVKALERKRIEEYVNRLEADIAAISTEIASKGSAGPEAAELLNMQQGLLEKLRKTEVYGRVVIDFENEKNYNDISIEDGDVIYAPKKSGIVSVLGEVYNPSTFVLDNGDQHYNQYIQLAGGYKDNANKKDVYVIKANGSVETRKALRKNNDALESGDVVVVPFRIPKSNVRFKMVLETTKDILAITASTLMIAVAVMTLQK